MTPILPIEAVHEAILRKGPHTGTAKGETNNPFYQWACNFQVACNEIWKAPMGADFIKYLAAMAHPCKHIPCSDPIQAAHVAGRAEVVAFIVLMASPDFIPNLAHLAQTQTTEQHHEPGTTKNRRKKQGSEGG